MESKWLVLFFLLQTGLYRHPQSRMSRTRASLRSDYALLLPNTARFSWETRKHREIVTVEKGSVQTNESRIIQKVVREIPTYFLLG